MKARLSTTAVLVGLGAVAFLTGCTSEARKARSEFVTGCKEGGGSSAICSCVYDKLEDRFGADGMVRAVCGAVPNGFSAQLLQSAAACRND